MSGFFQLMLPINQAMLHGGNQSKGWQMWGRASWQADTISVSATALIRKLCLTFGDSQPLLLFCKAAEGGFQCLRHHFFAAGS